MYQNRATFIETPAKAAHHDATNNPTSQAGPSMTRAVRDPIAETLGGISPGALPLTAPTVERHGDEFTIRWAEHSVDLVFTGIRESSGGLHAELSIQRDGEEVHWSRLGLASSRSRDGIVKLLERSRCPRSSAGAARPRRSRRGRPEG